METLLAITRLFVDEADPQIAEDFVSASVECSANVLKRPLLDWAKKAFANISASDVGICDVTVEENLPVSLNSQNAAGFPEALATLDQLQQVAGASASVRVNLKIAKKFRGNCLSIYSIKHFQKWLSELSLKRAFSAVAKHLDGKNFIVFECLDPDINFGTRSLHFVSDSSAISAPMDDRLKIFERRSELCHFENAAEMKVLPSDFHLEKRSNVAEWDDLFDRLCAALCVVYLSDVVFFKDDNDFNFKLKGYKTLSGEIKWTEVKPESADTFYKIVEWVYEGGGAADKMGLARNLLSLHVKDRQLLQVEAGLIHSIHSGYQIYLRDNVKQYIELKNKLVEFVNELSKKAAEQGKALSDSLSKNFTAFSSFLLSVVVVKAISQKDFTADLSPNVAYIAYAILFASFIHLCISVYLMNRELRAMEVSYGRMRTRYADLLAPQDVKLAFDDHHDYRQTMQNIKCKRTLYAVAWAVSILVFTVLVSILKAPRPSLAIPATLATNAQLSNTEQPIKPPGLTNVSAKIANLSTASTNTAATNKLPAAQAPKVP